MLNNHVANIAKQLADIFSDKSVTIRLEEIVNLIDDSANRTIDLIENSLPLTEMITKECLSVSKQLSKSKFKDVEAQVTAFLDNVINSLSAVHTSLEEIILAQKNQYTTAMVVNKFIDDLKNVDLKLVEIIDSSCDNKFKCEINVD